MLLYELFTVNPKTGVTNKIAEGSRAEMGEMQDYRRHNARSKDEKELKYATYCGGALVSSTYSGGANPHDWKIGHNVKRKHSGLRVK